MIQEDHEEAPTDEQRQYEDDSQRQEEADDYTNEQSELQALQLLSLNIVDLGQRYGQMESRVTERLTSLELQSTTLQKRVQQLSGRQHEAQTAAQKEAVLEEE